MKYRILVLTLLIVSIPLTSEATVYKWRDDAGKLHFTDSLNKVPLKYRKNQKKPIKSTPESPPQQIKKEPQQTKKDPLIRPKPATAPAPEPIIGEGRTKFSIRTWKGKKVRISGFRIGYWKDRVKNIKTKTPFHYRPGYHLGAVFKIKKDYPDETISIHLNTIIPLKGKNGQTRTFSSSTTLPASNVNKFEKISIEFNQDWLEKFEIPGDWTLKFKNNKKVFKSMIVHVVNP